MALIKCTECSHDVSTRASVCPNCGCPVTEILKDLEEIKKAEQEPQKEAPSETVEQNYNYNASESLTRKLLPQEEIRSIKHKKIDFVDIFNAIIDEDRLTAKKLIDSEIKNITECSTAISMAIIKEIKLHKRVPSQATIDNIVCEKEKQNDLNYSNGSTTVTTTHFTPSPNTARNYQNSNYTSKPLHVESTPKPNVPTCPICGSTNIRRITATERGVNAVMFGVFGTKRKHQFECQNPNCKYRW